MISLPTRAISLYVPWVWALMYAEKDVENRHLGFPRLPVGTEVWIHASLFPGKWKGRDGQLSQRGLDDLYDEWLSVRVAMQRSGFDQSKAPPVSLKTLSELRGHIVGRVTITGYVRPEDEPSSPWYVPGSLGIQVAKPVPLATPVQARGALGCWPVPAPVLDQLKEAA